MNQQWNTTGADIAALLVACAGAEWICCAADITQGTSADHAWDLNLRLGLCSILGAVHTQAHQLLLELIFNRGPDIL